jgi:hypothetical protein
MAEWRISGTYLETCNCDPGCGCNFRGIPSSPEGNCEAFLANDIEHWREGEIAQSERLHVDLPEMKYDVSGRHAVFSRFGYSNVSGFVGA